jgi:hypothetical protein
VVVPTNYLALTGSVRQALSKHIPTVVIRSSLPIPPGQGLSYILNDDQETGRRAARALRACWAAPTVAYSMFRNSCVLRALEYSWEAKEECLCWALTGRDHEVFCVAGPLKLSWQRVFLRFR